MMMIAVAPWSLLSALLLVVFVTENYATLVSCGFGRRVLPNKFENGPRIERNLPRQGLLACWTILVGN